MAVKNTKFKLERSEYHQVEVTYSFEFTFGDQEVWNQLRELAIETGEVTKRDFPSKASKNVEDWQKLYKHAGERVKEISKRLTDRWVSEEQGTVELSISALDEKDHQLCDSIVVT